MIDNSFEIKNFSTSKYLVTSISANNSFVEITVKHYRQKNFAKGIISIEKGEVAKTSLSFFKKRMIQFD